jgi:6,7-dimethyl-8-ribityllumazine synthase
MKFKFDKNKNKEFLHNKNIAIVLGYFYSEIADKLLLGAEQTLQQYGLVKPADVFYAPGAFEIPLLAKKIAKTNRYDGIITLGAVINGETPHFDFVCSECARGVADVSYQFEVPSVFGVLTTLDMAQTEGRAGGYKGNKGNEATLALIEMLYVLDEVENNGV